MAKCWQASNSKDYILYKRRNESVPWMLWFKVEGFDFWEGLHFWNLNLRIIISCGQCSISYDLGSWFRGRRSASKTCFGNLNALQRSCVSSARNACKVAFSDFEAHSSAEVVRRSCGMLAKLCIFGFPSETLCGDRACWSPRMLVVLLDLQVQPSAEIVRFHRAECRESCQYAFAIWKGIFYKWSYTEFWCRDRDTDILHKWSYHRDLAQEIAIVGQVTLKDLGAEILTERSWTRDPHTEILRKEVLQDPDAEILTQRSCTSGSTEILHKWRWSYSILKQRSWQRSCTRDPHTEIWHKRSYRILMHKSWHRNLAQEIRKQRSCTGKITFFVKLVLLNRILIGYFMNIPDSWQLVALDTIYVDWKDLVYFFSYSRLLDYLSLIIWNSDGYISIKRHI